MYVYIHNFCNIQTSITWPQDVHFHYFKVYYRALVEMNFMVQK